MALHTVVLVTATFVWVVATFVPDQKTCDSIATLLTGKEGKYIIIPYLPKYMLKHPFLVSQLRQVAVVDLALTTPPKLNLDFFSFPWPFIIYIMPLYGI
jgi:hypothetical protein